MGIICLSLNRIKTIAAIIESEVGKSFENNWVVYHKRRFRMTQAPRVLSPGIVSREDKSGDIGKSTLIVVKA